MHYRTNFLLTFCFTALVKPAASSPTSAKPPTNASNLQNDQPPGDYSATDFRRPRCRNGSESFSTDGTNWATYLAPQNDLPGFMVSHWDSRPIDVNCIVSQLKEAMLDNRGDRHWLRNITSTLQRTAAHVSHSTCAYNATARSRRLSGRSDLVPISTNKLTSRDPFPAGSSDLTETSGLSRFTLTDKQIKYIYNKIQRFVTGFVVGIVAHFGGATWWATGIIGACPSVTDLLFNDCLPRVFPKGTRQKVITWLRKACYRTASHGIEAFDHGIEFQPLGTQEPRPGIESMSSVETQLDSGEE